MGKYDSKAIGTASARIGSRISVLERQNRQHEALFDQVTIDFKDVANFLSFSLSIDL